jgi:hypothetical protein
MKKFLVFLFTLIALFFVYTYFFIPEKIEISEVQFVKCNVNGAFRILRDKSSWKKWWPKKFANENKKEATNDSSFFYNGYSYEPHEIFYNAVSVVVSKNNTSIDSHINLIKISLDSTVVIWKCEMKAGNNPLKRISNYQKASKLQLDFTSILLAYKNFVEQSSNIYGVDFHVIMSQDSTMVATKMTSKTFPTTTDIYSMIRKLRNYITEENARENNLPMLNVKTLEDSTFETMVAIPVNKQLPGKGDIFFSRFVPWKVLTAEVHGGNKTVENALDQMKIYMGDYQKTAMAIPFQSLLTDRSKEPDTSKWITRIYTPVP